MNNIRYDEKLTFYIGKGGNSILLLSADGRKALLIDTKYFGAARKLRKEITAKDITIINTHFHIDHTRGNKLYPDAYVISGICPWELWDFDSCRSKRPDKVLNPGEEYRFQFDNEWIRIINIGSAHTYTDCIVYLENRKILISGDLIWNKIHPMVLDKKCDISNWIEALNFINNELEIKTVIPGHGEIADKSILIEMRDYFLSIKNALYNRKELQEVKDKYKYLKKIPFVSNFRNTKNKIKRNQRNNIAA